MKKNYIDLLENIYALAQTGIRYTKSPFDMERYQKLLDIVTQEYSEFTGLDTEVLKERFRKDLGYATPKVALTASCLMTTAACWLNTAATIFYGDCPAAGLILAKTRKQP